MSAIKWNPHLLPEWEIEAQLEHTQEAALSVYWIYKSFADARDPVTQASALVELNNRMFDLSSWLPGFDSERGEIVGDDEL